MTRKICICLCIVDIIHQEEIWRHFIEDSKNEKDFELVFMINQKIQTDIKFFNKYKISEPVIADWGTLEVVKVAMNAIKLSMEDPHVERFIFLSETCIPVKTFSYICSNLDPNFSYFTLFPEDDELKTGMWYVLNRKHALICADHALENKPTHYYPDECLFIQCLNSKSLRHELMLSRNMWRYGIVFVPWRFSEDFIVYSNTILYSNRSHGNPLNFKYIDENEIKDLVSNFPCMFARKFEMDAVVSKDGEIHQIKEYLPYVNA